MASQHSGFDLTSTDIIREDEGGFDSKATNNSLTVVTEHTKAFRAPLDRDSWEFTIFGSLVDSGSPGDIKHLWINFDTTVLDMQFVSGDSGAYIARAWFIRTTSGFCTYYYNLEGASVTSQHVRANSLAFPTTAGNIVIQTNVDDATDSISIKGGFIRSSGSS